MNKKEIIEILERIIRYNALNFFGYNTVAPGYEALQEAINLIDKQDKVIDQMAQEIFIEYNPHFSTSEQVKEYFYKEIENE